MTKAIGQPLSYTPDCIVTTLHGSPVLIEDFDTISLRFHVSEADFPDLSTFQSICGVRLHFEHNNLSDLTMVLTSPSGRSVVLVGPADPNGTQPSPFIPIDHDVYFVPLGSTIQPDPDLSSPWTNILPTTWGSSSSSYGGIYIPHNGEFGVQFDVGSALGIWELTIIDHFLNDEGLFKGFEIDFCMGAGLVCNPCEAQAGSFTQDSIYACKNDAAFDFSSVYVLGPTAPLEYDEELFVYDNNGDLVTAGAPPDISTLAEGAYEVYAFNILSSQYLTERSGLQSLSEDALVDSVDATGGELCMDISGPMVLMINIPDTTSLPDITLCGGDSTVFDNQSISTPGTWTRVLDDKCDLIEMLTVEVGDLNVVKDQDTLFIDCATGMTEYGVAVSGSQGQVTYEWSEEGSGTVLSTDSAFVFTTSQNYELTIQDDLCDTTLLVVTVASDAGLSVSIAANPPVLNCAEDTVNLVHNISFPFDSVVWYRDGIAFDRGRTLVRVGEEGVYEVSAFTSAGCEIATSIVITTDRKEPEAMIDLPNITCSDSFIDAYYTSSDDIDQSIWLRGTDTIGVGDTIPIDVADTYELVLIGTNQCTSTFPFDVMADVAPLDVEDVPTGDVILNCITPTIDISPTRDPTDVAEEYWIFGVADTFDLDVNITVSEANSYRYEVITTNGCKTTVRFNVQVDTLAPTYNVIVGSVTCDEPEPEIILSGLGDLSSATFQANDIVSSTDSSVVVASPGVVQIEVMDGANGCTVMDSYDVVLDQSILNIRLPGDTTLTCELVNAALDANFNGELPRDFFWIGPQGDTSFVQSLVVSDTGNYIFEAVGTNGCIYSDMVHVGSDESIPIIDVPQSVLITCDEENVQLEITDISDLQSVMWVIGADTINSFSIDVPIRLNSLEVLATGNNLCQNGRVIDVLYDTLPPVFSLPPDTLNCANDSVLVTAVPALNNHSFVWAGDDITALATATVAIRQPGAYALNAIDTSNGCFSVRSVEISEDYSKPSFSLIPIDTLTCNRTGVSLSINTAPQNDVLWTTSSGGQEGGPTILTNTGGDHLFTITGSNGCDTSGVISVPVDTLDPRVSLQDTYVLSCEDDMFFLVPDIMDPFESVLWTFKNGDVSTSINETISDDALEKVVVTGLNGCETEINFDISFATDRPSAVINLRDTTLCSGIPIDIRTDPVVSVDHRIFWFRDDILITEDETSVMSLVSGEYILQVLDTVSGCFGMDTVEVMLSDAPLMGFDIEVMDETCMEAGDGSLNIRDILGGSGQLSVTVDGAPADLMPIDNLAPGALMVAATDGLGCSIDTMVMIAPGGDVSVSLGPDITVERGEKVTIVPSISGDPIVMINWSGSLGTTLTGEDTLCYYPVIDEQIVVEVISASGCIEVDTINVSVFVDISKISVYVPNIMAYGSEMGNDELTLQLAPDITEITDFRIYDRWGQQVVHLEQLRNGEVAVAWDATFNGRRVEPGVYVYSYEMLTIYDDVRRRRTGDITVID